MVNRLRVAGAQIPDFAGKGRFGGFEKRLHDIGDVERIASLGTVVADGQGLAFQFLLQEHTEHRTIGAGRA